jgi:hypothetical protein
MKNQNAIVTEDGGMISSTKKARMSRSKIKAMLVFFDWKCVDKIRFFIYYTNIHLHVALSGNPTLHLMLRHMNPSALED